MGQAGSCLRLPGTQSLLPCTAIDGDTATGERGWLDWSGIGCLSSRSRRTAAETGKQAATRSRGKYSCHSTRSQKKKSEENRTRIGGWTRLGKPSVAPGAPLESDGTTWRLSWTEAGNKQRTRKASVRLLERKRTDARGDQVTRLEVSG